MNRLFLILFLFSYYSFSQKGRIIKIDTDTITRPPVNMYGIAARNNIMYLVPRTGNMIQLATKTGLDTKVDKITLNEILGSSNISSIDTTVPDYIRQITPTQINTWDNTSFSAVSSNIIYQSNYNPNYATEWNYNDAIMDFWFGGGNPAVSFVGTQMVVTNLTGEVAIGN